MGKRRILVVDVDAGIRETKALILRSAGFEVSTESNGFDALLHLKTSGVVPDLIISDVNTPLMSGFEFLSIIHRRFPQIRVIASSSAFRSGEAVPCGIFADAFHMKAGSDPSTLLKMTADLLATPTDLIRDQHASATPVRVPRAGHDSKGHPFVVITCTDCFRSFPLSVQHRDLQEVQETDCLFCPTRVRYIVDFSSDVMSSKPLQGESVTRPANLQRQSSKQRA